jgi:EAL domain-containing protein (putative c-di-GMP-specific phosphodiesterase class I)
MLLDVEHRWRAEAVAAIARSGAPGLFFLNVDTRILDDPRFRPGTTSDLVSRHGLSRSRFVFEITERDPALRARRLSELLGHYSAQGYGIALDDLGAGHSSLHVLVQLRPDLVKLDRELCHGVATDPMRRALVDALVTFSTRVSLRLVAEGIERADDLNVLMELGVQYGQGFLLGRPQPEPLGCQRAPLAAGARDA